MLNDLLYCGMPIIENQFCVETIEHQNRPHRKKRINKKWLKRYGFWTEKRPCMYVAGGKIIAHPVVMAKLKEAI